MKFGYVYPGGEARDAAECALAAEAAGWDGFFVWEPVWGVDAWVTLAAAAMRTERIRLGTMLTPVSRRRPWKLASETATVDRLSNGRLILSVGLGAVDTGFTQFGEVTDRKQRAELLDEGLDILTGLWHGQPFKHEGKHYHVTETTFCPPLPPVQTPRIPIWVVGAWPHPKSMERALRYDGLLAAVQNAEGKFVNIIRHAQRLTGIETVYTVIGGFHLSGRLFEPIIAPTVAALQAISPRYLLPAHCTGWSATLQIAHAMPDAFIPNAVGTTLNL